MQQRPLPLIGCGLSLLAVFLIIACIGSSLIVLPIAAFAGGVVDRASASSGPGPCTPALSPGDLLGTTPTITPLSPPCSVVAWAITIVAHLALCGGHGDPDPSLSAPGLDACYTTGSLPNAMPQAVLDFLQKTYPGDVAGWASGSFQCVSLILAAYGLAGLPLPYQGDAVTFWAHYRTMQDWLAIPAGGSPLPGTPGIDAGLPEPGDMIVWQHTPATLGAYDPGHIAIVTAVMPPTKNQSGRITFAQSNAFAPSASVIITPQPDLHVLPWPGGDAYTTLGYIRYLGAH